MADPQVRIHIAEATIERLSGDVEMDGRDGAEIVEVLGTDPGKGPEARGEEEEEEEQEEKVFRVTFVEYVSSISGTSVGAETPLATSNPPSSNS